MFDKDTYHRYYWPFLGIGLLCYLAICFDITMRIYPALPFQVGFSDFWRTIFFIWFLVGHYLFFKNYIEDKELYNVETLLKVVFGIGVVTLLIYYMVDLAPDFLQNLAAGNWSATRRKITPINPMLRHTLDLILPYFMIIYFLAVMVLYKKLIFVKRTRTDFTLWYIFQIALLGSLIFNFNDLRLPSVIIKAYIAGGGILVLLLAIRLRWVALLDMREKWSCIFLLLPVTIISLLLSKHLLSFKDAYILHIDLFRNVFLLIMAGLVNVYNIFALLALVFNLPIARVMKQRDREVDSFREFNQLVKGEFKPNKVFKQLFVVAFSNTDAEAGFIRVRDTEHQYDYFESRHLKQPDVHLLGTAIPELEGHNEPDTPYLWRSGRYTYLLDAKRAPAAHDMPLPYRCMIHFPITVNRREVGRLVLCKSFSQGFDEYMIRMVSTYLDHVQLVLENAENLHELIDSERAKKELAIAQQIQKGLLPADTTEERFINLSGVSIPASEVGGDYYDWYFTAKNHCAATIADVSGKGTGAAFHMAEVKGIFHALIQKATKPADFMLQANEAVSHCFEKNTFVTAVYLSVSQKNRTITYCRAGHCPLLYYSAKDKKARYLEDKGLGLGIMRNAQFKKHIHVNKQKYATGDRLILYTDGILEAPNERRREQYGYKRLMQCVESTLNENPETASVDLNQNILDHVRIFMAGGHASSETKPPPQPFDDMSLLVIQF